MRELGRKGVWPGSAGAFNLLCSITHSHSHSLNLLPNITAETASSAAAAAFKEPVPSQSFWLMVMLFLVFLVFVVKVDTIIYFSLKFRRHDKKNYIYFLIILTNLFTTAIFIAINSYFLHVSNRTYPSITQNIF